MKKLLPFLAVLALCAGCTSTTYTHDAAGTVKITRRAMLTKQSINNLEVGVDATGLKSVKMRGYSNEAEKAAAIAAAVAEALK